MSAIDFEDSGRVLEVVGDRPTPDPGQLFQVRTANTRDTRKLTDANGEELNGPVTDPEHIVIPAGGIVIGKRKLTTTDKKGPKRRAVKNPVYSVTGVQLKGDLVGNEAYKQYLSMRVFGVAADGISGADAEAIHRDSNNLDAKGRFSVIHQGMASIVCPYNSGGDANMHYKDKKIGDVVLAAPWAENKCSFYGDPDPKKARRIPVKFLDREIFQDLMTSTTSLKAPTLAKLKVVLDDSTLADNPDSVRFAKMAVASFMVGFLCQTGTFFFLGGGGALVGSVVCAIHSRNRLSVGIRVH